MSNHCLWKWNFIKCVSVQKKCGSVQVLVVYWHSGWSSLVASVEGEGKLFLDFDVP